MWKILGLLFFASGANALFGTMWRRSMAVTSYTTFLAVGGLSVGIFGTVVALTSNKPIVANGQYRVLWPLVPIVFLGPLFYAANSMLLKRLPFSRTYPLVATGTMLVALLIDTFTGDCRISLRVVAGVLLAICAIWCINGE